MATSNFVTAVMKVGINKKIRGFNFRLKIACTMSSSFVQKFEAVTDRNTSVKTGNTKGHKYGAEFIVDHIISTTTTT